MFWLNLKQIRHTQVRDEGLTRQKMERDYNDPGSISAEDIPYDANLSTKQVVQNLGEAAINPFNGNCMVYCPLRYTFSLITVSSEFCMLGPAFHIPSKKTIVAEGR